MKFYIGKLMSINSRPKVIQFMGQKNILQPNNSTFCENKEVVDMDIFMTPRNSER